MTNFDSLKLKFQIFMINSNSGLQTMWKSGLVWLSRPIFMVLVIWAKFGHIWTSRSRIAWETPIFYWLPRFCIPKGTWNWPYFGWDIFLHFCLGSKSQETPVKMVETLVKILGHIFLWKVLRMLKFIRGIFGGYEVLDPIPNG